MIHLDENIIELFVLGDERACKREKQIKRHLEECLGCRKLYQDIKNYYEEVEREKNSVAQPLSRMTERSLVRKRDELEPYFARPDTEVVTFSEISAPSMWKRVDRFRRERPVASVLGLFAISLTGALLAIYLWNPMMPNSNPAYIHLNTEKGLMEVFNKENHMLWSIPGQDLANVEHEIAEYATSYWQVTDLHSDGKNDVVTSIPGLGSAEIGGAVLQIFDPSGRLLRKVDIDPGPVSFRGHQYSQSFGITNFLVAEINSDANKEIFVGITDGHSPYCIVRMDSHGDVLGEYWHFGNLFGMSYVRFADGRKYLVLCGENDVQDRSTASFPVIVVLDPAQIVGTTQSVVTPGFGYKASNAEVYYVRLPNSDMNRVLHAYAAVRRLDGKSDTELSFDLESGPSSMATDGTPSFGAVFSRSMTVLSYSASNTSVTMHGELENEGLVKGKVDKAYLDGLKNRVRYWNGKEWVKKATRIEISRPTKE